MNDNLNKYLSPILDFDSVDTFYVRSSIIKGIESNKKLLGGKLLDIGCGKKPYKSILTKPFGSADIYIGLDFENAVTPAYDIKPDLIWDGKVIPCENNTIDSCLATEVLEHCFKPQILLSEAYRILKQNGYLYVTVPFLWPLHDIPNDEFRYTPYSLEKLFRDAGFINIKIESLGGWNASLGQMISLWLKRSGLNPKKSKILYHLLKPLIKWLYKKDYVPIDFYSNTYMVTGLSVLAQK